MTCPHCESDNIVEKETEHLFWKELYIYCDDCKRTVFCGWKAGGGRMRHIMQIMAMASDILIIGFAIALIYSCFKTGSGALWIISIVLLLGTYHTWKEQGGFIAWTKEGRAGFYEGWDKITKKGQNG